MNDDGPIRSDAYHLRVGFARDHVTYLDATVADGDTAIGNVIKFGTLPTLEPWRVRLASQPTDVHADAKYRVSFRIRADKPREVIVTVSEEQKPWTNLGLYGRIPVTEEWQSVTREFTAKADASNALFSFDLGGSDIAVQVAEVSFERLNSHAADEMPAAR